MVLSSSSKLGLGGAALAENRYNLALHLPLLIPLTLGNKDRRQFRISRLQAHPVMLFLLEETLQSCAATSAWLEMHCDDDIAIFTRGLRLDDHIITIAA